MTFILLCKGCGIKIGESQGDRFDHRDIFANVVAKGPDYFCMRCVELGKHELAEEVKFGSLGGEFKVHPNLHAGATAGGETPSTEPLGDLAPHTSAQEGGAEESAAPALDHGMEGL